MGRCIYQCIDTGTKNETDMQMSKVSMNVMVGLQGG